MPCDYSTLAGRLSGLTEQFAATRKMSGLVWEFDNQPGGSRGGGAPQWVSVDSQLATALTANSRANTWSFWHSNGRFNYAIDMRNLTQLNVRTQTLRRLRLVLGPTIPSAVIPTSVPNSVTNPALRGASAGRQTFALNTISNPAPPIPSEIYVVGSRRAFPASWSNLVAQARAQTRNSRSASSSRSSSPASSSKSLLKAAQYSCVDPSALGGDDTCAICLDDFADLAGADSTCDESTAKESNGNSNEEQEPRKKRRISNTGTGDSVPLAQTKSSGQDNEEKCVRLIQCAAHYFHLSCIKQWFAKGKPKCPSCQHYYGEEIGNMPAGLLTIHRNGPPLSGFEKHKSISIRYVIPDGLQSEDHPSPGNPFSGTNRTAYLPDTPEGDRVLKLLIRAFQNRVTFTIGHSLTTGRDNCIVWNGIHHKTSMHGGPFGYPDSTYLNRVTLELAAKGIL